MGKMCGLFDGVCLVNPLLGALCALVLASGCHTPPARVAACNLPCRQPSRKRVNLRQVSCDSGVQFAVHPVTSTKAALCQAAGFWEDAGQWLVHRAVHCCQGKPDCLVEDRPILDAAALEARLHKKLGSELEPAQVDLFACGDEALAALKEVIDSATCRLDVMMYIWDSDPVGDQIAQWLAAKAGPDLPVRVLVDGGGNVTFGLPEEASAGEVNRVVCWLSRQPYVQVIRTRDPCCHYDHRKLVLADGKIAYSGGRNFSEQDFFHQHDVNYAMIGPLVRRLAERFECFWQWQGGKPLPLFESLEPPQPNALARIVGTDPPKHELQQAVYAAVDAAKHHVYVENFSLSECGLLGKLEAARRRGADVRAVLTIHGNSPVMNRASHVIANRLLQGGVRVYLYPEMTHVKAMVVDGVWAYTGTGNFDTLSMRRNREVGLAISSGPLIAELEERVFLADFQPEWEVHEPLPATCADYLAVLLAMLAL